jgi:hypothetical protein
VVIPKVCSVCFYPFSHLSYFPIVVLHKSDDKYLGKEDSVLNCLNFHRGIDLAI